MQARQLLLKLRVCRGIGFRGEFKIYRWLVESIPELTATFDVQVAPAKLIEVGMVPRANRELFYADWQSYQIEDVLSFNAQMCRAVTLFDPEYPPALLEAGLPPVALFYQGELQLLNRPLLGVVGSRRQSAYAKRVLRQLLPPIVKKGIVTVSGLSLGVDGLCHRITLGSGGRTIGVIGTGLDHCYPRPHLALQAQIAHRHLLLSEYPLGVGVRKHHFLERNRIIAGLVKNILIVEAPQRSDSLITANLALNNNLTVMAVPGPIGVPLSVGCNQLIVEGAKPILTADDILADF